MSRLVVSELYERGADAFVEALGFLFEHSPWVVRGAFARGPFADRDALLNAANAVLAAATLDEKLALIRAHPELAGKAAIAGELTEASQLEQKSAGLDRLTPEEFARFHALNDAYRQRFDFPFIICVRLNDKASILSALTRRLLHDRDAEIEAALVEISRIARLRLDDAAGVGPAEPQA